MEQHSSEPPDGQIYMPFISTLPGGSRPLADSWLSGCGWASRPQQGSIARTNRFGRPVSRDLNPADSPRRRVPEVGKLVAGTCQANVRV